MEGKLRPDWAVKALIVVVVASIFFRCVSAANHTVGGFTGWDLNSNLQAWTATSTFRTGDFLVFKYGPSHDVLEVSHWDFNTCRSIRPIATYSDGDTVVELTSPGKRYFICGRRGHCSLGLRLAVQILPSLVAAEAPAPAPSATAEAHAPAPSVTAAPGRDADDNRTANAAAAPPDFDGSERRGRPGSHGRSPSPPHLEMRGHSPPEIAAGSPSPSPSPQPSQGGAETPSENRGHHIIMDGAVLVLCCSLTALLATLD